MTEPAQRNGSPATPLILLLPLLGLILLVGCGSQEQITPTPPWPPAARTSLPPTPALPSVEISLAAKDVSVAPLPLRAGVPFTVTLLIHNNGGMPTPALPVLVHMSPLQETIGYLSFLDVLTVTLPSTRPVSLEVPVHWNFAGGQHRLWVQVNRLPEVWQSETPTWPEKNWSDNSVLLDLMVQPFDAYLSELCPGRVDLEIDPSGVIAEPGSERVRLRVHNAGNQAAYNLPVIVSGEGLSGIGYTPAIPPCGGMAEVWVQVDRPLVEGETISLRINPLDWADGLAEDDFGNNEAEAQVEWPAAGSALPETVDYDFSLASADVESPELWLVLVTVHNLGTRDAARVPIRIENESGRSVSDVIPLVQGGGVGVAAIRVGTLWKRGQTLTLTVNPAGARGAFPESDHSNNVTTFALP